MLTRWTFTLLASCALAPAAFAHCDRSADYESFCYSCHRLPVTKRECVELGNEERARACFESLGDVWSVHGPAIYRVCYAAPDASRIAECGSLKYRVAEYTACLEGR